MSFFFLFLSEWVQDVECRSKLPPNTARNDSFSVGEIKALLLPYPERKRRNWAGATVGLISAGS